MAELTKFSHLLGNRGRGTRFFTGSGNTAISRMHNEKYANITLIYGRIAKIIAA